jgi:CRISPR type IV-associated protein Csf3
MGYRDRYNLEPLRIRAMLRSGVVSDHWLPLDGILLYQSHRDQCGVQEQTFPGQYSGQMKIATLPLGIIHPGRRNWYYQCSWAQWSHNIEGQDYWNKRFDNAFADLINFDNKRGKVIIEEAKYKAYHMPIFYRSALWVEWYCMGDKTEIEYLLSTMTHIGKKSVQGWGRVSNWFVESWNDNWSVWRNDQLMRGIPVEDVAELDRPFQIGNYGIRPSYWKSNNQKLLALPE